APVSGVSLAPVVRGALVGGRYRLLGPLGRGGVGAVYEGIDQLTDKLRAVKVVDDAVDSDTKARFCREASIAGRVESAHLVEIVDAGHDAELGVLYLVMERLRGEDLGARLARGVLATADALEVLRQVARGLACLHADGIVHRDLKPENVFLQQDEGGRL